MSAITDRSTTASVKGVVGLGLIATSLILLFSSMRGWPFHTLTAAPWFFQISTSSTVLKYAFLVGFYLSVALLCLAWWRLMKLSRMGAVTGRIAAATYVLWSIPLLIGSPLFSGDIYVYVIDGLMIARGLDPYSTGISALGPAAEVLTVHPLWRDTPSMYGPIFMRLMQAITFVSGDSLVWGSFIFRLFAFAAVALGGWAVWSLAGRLGRIPGEAFTFALLNPIALLHLVGGGHNDALMVGLLLAGLAVGVGADSNLRRLVAIVLCVAAAGMKAPGLAGVLVLGWIWAGGQSVPRRLWSATKAGVVGVAGFVGITAVLGLGWGWLNALDVPGLAHPLLAPANAVGIGIGGLFGVAEGGNSITRVVATMASLVLAIFFVVRTRRTESALDVLRASGWSLIALAWLGPAVYPWYLVWGLALVGLAGAKAVERYVLPTVVVLSFVIAPGGYGNLDLVGGVWRTAIALALTALLIAAVRRVMAVNNFALRKESSRQQKAVNPV